MKNLLKIGFTDTFEPAANFFMTILSERFDIVRDDVNPDYLFFGDRNFGNNNTNFNNRRCIKIFYTGENQRFWDYACHYAVSFDHMDNERHYRLPLYVLWDFDNQHRNLPHAKTLDRDPSELTKKFKDKFCSFVVKNGSCDKRNFFFDKLSQYKRVDSAGPLFNNMGWAIPRGDDSVANKLKFLNDYKFNLCFENSSYPGYATEKLYEAYIGGTVPIYWGSPTIECDFNPKAFLNWHDYLDDDAFIQAIIEVDSSPEKYEEIFLEPLFKDWNKIHKRYDNKYMDLNRFVNWFEKNVYKGVLNDS